MKLTVPAVRAAEQRQPTEASNSAKRLLEEIDALLAEIVSAAVAAEPASA